MHFEVELGDAELAHVAGGGHEEAAGLELGGQGLGHGGGVLVVVAEGGDAFGLPGPVFADLAGELDEVPGHAGAGVGFELGVAEHDVHHVAEFVEEHHGIPVAEEGGAIGAGRGHVAHQGGQVRGAVLAVLTGFAIAQGHDPGAFALHAAGEEVHVEGAQVLAGAVIGDGKGFDGGVPGFDGDGIGFLAGLHALGGELGEGDAVEVGEDVEHAVYEPLAFQVGADAVGVEVVHFLGHFAQVEAAVPGVQGGGDAAGALLYEVQHLGAFGIEGGFHLLHHAVHKCQGVFPAADHAAVGGQVCKGFEAEEFGELAAQFHDAGDDGGVVVLAGADGACAFPAGFAGGFYGAVAQHFVGAGGAQADAPGGGGIIAMHVFAGILACFVEPVGAHARQCGGVGDDEFPGFGGVLDVLAELQFEHGHFVLDFFLAFFLLRAQVGALVMEVLDDLLHVALPGGGEFLHPGLGGGAAQHGPELFVCQHLGAQFIPQGHEFFLHLAQAIAIGHGFEVVDAVLHLFELILCVGEGQEGVFESSFLRFDVADSFQTVAGHHHGGGGVGAGLFRGQFRPLGVHAFVEKRVLTGLDGLLHFLHRGRCLLCEKLRHAQQGAKCGRDDGLGLHVYPLVRTCARNSFRECYLFPGLLLAATRVPKIW